MEVFFDQHIGVFKNVFSKDYCEKVIQNFENNIESTENRSKQNGFNTPPTEQDDISLPVPLVDQELRDTFNKKFFENVLPLYYIKYKLKNIITSEIGLDDFKIQKTLPTEGYHVWHAENCHNEHEIRQRIAVWTLYLNDVEEGGETEFLLQSKRIKPEQGTICIFPAGFTHIHRGNPPLSGKKYIVTGWISFPNNKKSN